MAVHAGSWFGLPDFGITEKIGATLGKPQTYQGGSNIVGSQPQPKAYSGQVQGVSTGAVFGPPAPTKITSSGGGGYAPTTATNNPSSSFNQGVQQVQQQQDNGNSQIEADFNSAMSELSNAESGLRSQAGIASSTIDQQAGAAKNEITNTQGVAEGAANTSLQTAEKQGTSAMQQARDLFRQTQQSNISQLSALGISSSSVAEALAERLGIETARRIAGVTGSLDEVRQNTVNELGRIKTYYQGKISDIQSQVENQKAQIQQSLMAGLNQINSARNQAASAKSQARANLLSQAQDQIGQLTMQQQQFQQSLDAWAAQKSAALTPIAQDPNYVNNLISTANTFNQQFSPTGFNYLPSVNVNAQGTMTGQINPQKKPQDELANPFAVPAQ